MLVIEEAKPPELPAVIQLEQDIKLDLSSGDSNAKAMKVKKIDYSKHFEVSASFMISGEPAVTMLLRKDTHIKEAREKFIVKLKKCKDCQWTDVAWQHLSLHVISKVSFFFWGRKSQGEWLKVHLRLYKPLTWCKVERQLLTLLWHETEVKARTHHSITLEALTKMTTPEMRANYLDGSGRKFKDWVLRWQFLT